MPQEAAGGAIVTIAGNRLEALLQVEEIKSQVSGSNIRRALDTIGGQGFYKPPDELSVIAYCGWRKMVGAA